MRILIVSDIHDNYKNFVHVAKKESYDAIFVSGDFTYFKPLSIVLGYIDAVREVTEAPIYFVPGNCDPEDLLDFEDKKLGFINIHNKIVEINEHLLLGFGGSTETPFFTNIEFSDDQIERELAKFLDIDGNRTIMLTHTPPYNTVDILLSGNPAGSHSIRRFVETTKPLAVFSGHIHESRGIKKLGRTIIVNPGPLMRGHYATAILSGGNIEVNLKKI